MEKMEHVSTSFLMAEISNISAVDEPDALILSFGFGSMRVQTDDREFFDRFVRARASGILWGRVLPVTILGEFLIVQTMTDECPRPQTVFRLKRVMTEFSGPKADKPAVCVEQ